MDARRSVPVALAITIGMAMSCSSDPQVPLADTEYG